MIGKRTNDPKGNVGLAGLGQDPADMNTDRHPYLLGAKATPTPGGGAARGWLSLALRKIRTSQLTPGGLSTAPEVKDALGDVRVPNVLQRMSGEMTGSGEVGEGRPEFHSPAQPPTSGVVSAGNQPPGQLQASHQRGGRGLGAAARAIRTAAPGTSPEGAPAGAPTGFVPESAPSSGQEDVSAVLSGIAGLPHFARGGRLKAGMGIVGERGPEEILALPGGGVQVQPLHGKAAKRAIRTRTVQHFDQGGELDPAAPAATSGSGPTATPTPAANADTAKLLAMPGDAGASPNAALGPVKATPPPMVTLPPNPTANERSQPDSATIAKLAGLPAPAAPPATLTPAGTQPYNKDVLAALTPTPNLAAPAQPARDRYNADVQRLAALTPPDRNNPALQAHGWQKALDVLAGIGTGVLTMNPLAGVGAYKALSGMPYRQAEQQYGQQSEALKNAVGAEREPAMLEQQRDQDEATKAENRLRDARQATLDQQGQTEADNTPATVVFDSSGKPTGSTSRTGKFLPGQYPAAFASTVEKPTVAPGQIQETPTGIMLVDRTTGKATAVMGPDGKPLMPLNANQGDWGYGGLDANGNVVAINRKTAQTKTINATRPSADKAKADKATRLLADAALAQPTREAAERYLQDNLEFAESSGADGDKVEAALNKKYGTPKAQGGLLDAIRSAQGGRGAAAAPAAQPNPQPNPQHPVGSVLSPQALGVPAAVLQQLAPGKTAKGPDGGSWELQPDGLLKRVR